MKRYLIPIALPLLLAACTNQPPNPPVVPNETAVAGEGTTPDFSADFTPSFDYDVKPYAGQTATDTPLYPEGDDGLNPELTQWAQTVTVTYQGTSATVAMTDGCTATYTLYGADVDIALGATDFIHVVATGHSDSGSLRITGDKRHMLTLDALTLTATDRPAINDQNAKRVFLYLKGRSLLADGAAYTPTAEDRKGCLFAEGHIVVCGGGVLEVEGRHQHGVATDGFLYVNPGASLVVTDAVRNAVHAKGSQSDANALRGIEVAGGYLYAHTSAPRGKALKSDANISLRGGRVELYASGNADTDPSDGTLSSPACIKGDRDVKVSGGNVTLTAPGIGAKGIKANGNVTLAGGILHVALSGNSMQGEDDSATPKAVKADGNLVITAGGNYLSAVGIGAVGLEADGSVAVDGGQTYAFGTANGLRAATARHNLGIMLAGGTANSDIPGAQVLSLTDVNADDITQFKDADDETAASFRWPVSLGRASLLLCK